MREFLAILLSVCLLGCGERGGAPALGATNALTVAVSIAPQAWLVEQVGGNRVKVVTLVGPSESPHTYQPSDAQITQIMRAKAFFRMGATFEAGRWFRSIEEGGRVPVFDLREGVDMLAMAEHGHEAHDHHPVESHDEYEGLDPHIWLSPRRLMVQAETVMMALKNIDPENGRFYIAGLAMARADLRTLDQELSAKLEPYRGRAFLVFHPAWGYFADDYGLRQIAIEVEGKAPTDRELTALQELAKREGIKVVFVQPQFGGQTAQVIADAIGARIESLDPQAHDLPENLRRAADAIAQSMEAR